MCSYRPYLVFYHIVLLDCADTVKNDSRRGLRPQAIHAKITEYVLRKHFLKFYYLYNQVLFE